MRNTLERMKTAVEKNEKATVYEMIRELDEASGNIASYIDRIQKSIL